MSDPTWTALCALLWFCSNPWRVTTAIAIYLGAAIWIGTRDPRDMRNEAAALESEADAAEHLDLCELLWDIPAYDHITEEEQ